MSPELPVKTNSKQIGEVASAHMQLYFRKLGWNYRCQEDQNDFGVDGEVEIVDRNLVTGTIFKCQVKGTERLVWNGEHAVVRTKRATFDYWCRLGVPVVALLVDNATAEAFWSLPLAHHSDPGESSVPITFVQSNRLSPDGTALRAVAMSWHRSFSPVNLLAEVPYFHALSRELRDTIDWGDAWTSVDPELDGQARLFYKHVVQLRLSLGLDATGIIPLDDFYLRNCGIWHEDAVLYHGTFSELMAYLLFFYDEAMNVLMGRLQNVKLCFENRALVNYFRLDPGFSLSPNVVEVQYSDPRAREPSFHGRIEAELEKRGALRSRWQERTVRGP